MLESLFAGFLLIATLFCSLVTGVLFTYAVVVMPGLSKLGDGEFIRAFQVTDGIIQNNQPLFMLTWMGSIISVLGAILSSLVSVGLSEAWLIVVVGAVYLLGVQGITISIHLPLNRRIQRLKTHEMDEKSLNNQRVLFENRWNHYNNIRTAIAFFVSLALLFVTISR